MIFVTVGTREEPFDRLIREVDRIGPELDQEITVQLGHTNYEPGNAEWFRFTDEDTIRRLYAEATVVVAHAGAGTVLMALSNGKPIVIVPRSEERGEAQNDHQLDLARAIGDRDDVFVVYDIDDLQKTIQTATAVTETEGITGSQTELHEFLRNRLRSSRSRHRSDHSGTADPDT